MAVNRKQRLFDELVALAAAATAEDYSNRWIRSADWAKLMNHHNPDLDVVTEKELNKALSASRIGCLIDGGQGPVFRNRHNKIFYYLLTPTKAPKFDIKEITTVEVSGDPPRVILSPPSWSQESDPDAVLPSTAAHKRPRLETSDLRKTTKRKFKPAPSVSVRVSPSTESVGLEAQAKDWAPVKAPGATRKSSSGSSASELAESLKNPPATPMALLQPSGDAALAPPCQELLEAATTETGVTEKATASTFERIDRAEIQNGALLPWSQEDVDDTLGPNEIEAMADKVEALLQMYSGNDLGTATAIILDLLDQESMASVREDLERQFESRRRAVESKVTDTHVSDSHGL